MKPKQQHTTGLNRCPFEIAFPLTPALSLGERENFVARLTVRLSLTSSSVGLFQIFPERELGRWDSTLFSQYSNENFVF